MTVLVSAADLAEELRSAATSGVRGPVLLDVRWSLGGPPGRQEYAAGHLPGAVYVDLETELAGHGPPTAGRHPLPAVEDLQAAARRWGLRDGDRVVAYDATGNLAAARAWWLLRWAGMRDVRLLDGGLPAWEAAGGAIETGETGEVVPVPGEVTLSAGHLPTIDLDGAAVLPEHGVLLDARAAERFRGEVEPVDPVAGHIPGAVSAPTAALLGADGRFLPDDVLRERFAALGVGRDPAAPVGAYCGSGVTAAHTVAALAHLGIDAALYPGSWSQWCHHDRPVATG